MINLTTGSGPGQDAVRCFLFPDSTSENRAAIVLTPIRGCARTVLSRATLAGVLQISKIYTPAGTVPMSYCFLLGNKMLRRRKQFPECAGHLSPMFRVHGYVPCQEFARTSGSPGKIPCCLFLQSPFVQHCNTPGNGIPDIFKCLFYCLSLGVATRKSRAADRESAIFRVRCHDNFEYHTQLWEKTFHTENASGNIIPRDTCTEPCLTPHEKQIQ